MNPEIRKRLLWIAITIFILFSLLVLQFYRIQIAEGQHWVQQAQKQHFFIVKEPGRRGSFFSNGAAKKGHPPLDQPLVLDVPRYHLFADPLSIPLEHHQKISDYLVKSLSLSLHDKNQLISHLNKKSHSRKLAMWIDKEKYLKINSWWKSYAKEHHIPRNALFFVKDYQRSYPFGKLLGQVLHTVRETKDEKTHQFVPTGGLELLFNKQLQGKTGKRRLKRSPSHALETGEVISPPENGSDIYLTINHYLQAIVEEELEKGVKKCKAKGGWAVMMEPRTGEILALAQYPFFSPAEYQNYFNDPKLIEHTKLKAITDANEPGSTFKPITAAIALKANQELKRQGKRELFIPGAKMATSSGRFPGRSKPITDTSLHLFLNMDMALWKSSNIYFARLAEQIVNTLGNEWYRRELELFGIGTKTHVELPAESAGVLPTPGKMHPNNTQEWSKPTPFSLAFGHNVQVTSLQLARAYCVLANGGYLVEPTLIRKIVKNSQEEESYAEKRFPQVLDPLIARRVLQGLSYVTKTGGTATKADIPGYTEAGKSGTAKKIVNGTYAEKIYCASFAGFTPIDHPAYVLVVTMDEPEYGYIPGIGKNHHGGNCTAGVFREIGKRALSYLGIPPDDPFGYPHDDPRCDRKKTRFMPEVNEMRDLYNAWNNKKP